MRPSAIVMLVIVLGMPPSNARCADVPAPEVTFTASDGWVSFGIRQSEIPPSLTRLKVVDCRGKVIEEITVDGASDNRFATPSGDWFMVEITCDARMAIPIRLTKVGTAVVPNRVALSFDLRPCCRVPGRPFPYYRGASDIPIAFPKTTFELTEIIGWLFAMIGLLFLSCHGFVARALRRYRK